VHARATGVAHYVTARDAASLLAHLEGLGRKRSTLHGYESFLRVHLAPFFDDRPLRRIAPSDVEAFIAASRRSGRSVKSTLNVLAIETSSASETGVVGRFARRGACRARVLLPGMEGESGVCGRQGVGSAAY
jgi:hypothetical protein